VQAVLLEESEKMSSMSLLGHMAPMSLVLLVQLTLYNEPTAAASLALIAHSPHFTAVLGLNCLLAFFVNLANFVVTQHCGALTLQVLGNAKGAVAALLSVMIFRNPVTFLGCLGFGVTIAGVVAYSESRKQPKRQQILEEKRVARQVDGSMRVERQIVMDTGTHCQVTLTA
jgi:hypothetical protein